MSPGPDCQDEPRVTLMTDLEMPRCITNGPRSHHPSVLLDCSKHLDETVVPYLTQILLR